MQLIWFYTIVSVFLVSLISLVGVFTLPFNQKKVYDLLIFFVSFSAGTLMGDAFIHLIPEAYKNNESAVFVSLSLLAGILLFFVLEKVVHWRHCHHEPSKDHPHPFSTMILVGDALHNLIDGMIIAASFLISLPLGVATTVAVAFHEIPHEIGNFGSLVYGGFTQKRALLFNFLSALFSVLGAIIVLMINSPLINPALFLLPFAAGGFVYIAGTDLIPELHKHHEGGKGIVQVLVFVAGISLMLLLLVLG